MKWNEWQQKLSQRIYLMDGAMGTEIQQAKLTEEDYRGTLFQGHAHPLKGNHDVLVLTRPDVLETIHNAYLEAGSDIIETNTFNSTRISQADYHMEPHVYALNVEAARLARRCADAYTLKTPDQPRYVAGSIGPTNKTASISPDVERPGFRGVTFDQLVEAYEEQIRGLMEGGVDLLLIETIFDTLNARAALFAAENTFDKLGKSLPIMISVTVTDKSGRTLSGQTLEAFVTSMQSENVLSMGINCAFGAKDLIPYMEELSALTDKFTSVYPNAGLPNALGLYDELPKQTIAYLEEMLDGQWINLLGGCCGTTPEHIRFMKAAIAGRPPRQPAPRVVKTALAGLERVHIDPSVNFVNVGERTNVAGSAKFARLIREKKYEEALEIAKDQVENGAQIIDVNFDDGLLDSAHEMDVFLKLIASEPEIARVPIMIDSSKWEVILAGLKAIQGKAVVNSISLKNGEAEFLEQAKTILRFGAAVVVMAFDENGQAETFERKTQIAKRAYDLLTTAINFPPEDIIFDMNILAIATGMEEHNAYAVDYIEAVRWIKKNLPHAKTSGGLSNLSFSFRGNNTVREAMHSVFLYHAIHAGLDMAILNPGMIQIYDDIPKDLLDQVEAVVLNKSPEATEVLIQYASELGADKQEAVKKTDAWRETHWRERLKTALVRGITTYLEADLQEALIEEPSALNLIEGPLMDGMKTVGSLFGDGKMFLPQVVKSARVMKQAVGVLQPLLEAASAGGDTRVGKVVMATVKGDVHDIGKNIVGIVLQCNNFEVIDLGIMVPAEVILETAERERADIILLSGLITPSLDEMVHVAKAMAHAKMTIPLMIGGATTSKLHTGLKIAPQYKGPVVYTTDAPKAAEAAKALLSDKKETFVKAVYEGYEEVIRTSQQYAMTLVPIDQAISEAKTLRGSLTTQPMQEPQRLGITVIDDWTVSDLSPYIDWTFFFGAWGFKKHYPELLEDPDLREEAHKLLADAKAMLTKLETVIRPKGAVGLFEASCRGETIVFKHQGAEAAFPVFRQQREGSEYLSLADFVAEEDAGIADYAGLFAVTAGLGLEAFTDALEAGGDTYGVMLAKTLADRLAEAFAEKLHEVVRKSLWGYAPEENLSVEALHHGHYRGIRPAVGYPSLIDHAQKADLLAFLDVSGQLGITLTESFMMVPAASVSGLLFGREGSKYFDVFKVGADQVALQATLRNVSNEAMAKTVGLRAQG